MFYIASAFLEGEGLAFSSHAAVIATFGQQFARTGRVPVEFHRYLIDAQDTRNKADYNVEPNITQVDAAELLARAKLFLEFTQQQIDSFPPPWLKATALERAYVLIKSDRAYLQHKVP